MRARLKYLVAETLYRLGVLAVLLRRKARSGQFCVIGLHRILPAEMLGRVSSPAAMVMTTRVFGDLLAFLSREFDVIPGERTTTRSSSKPALMITFDDGWADNLEFGLPLLREHQTPASLFVVTGMIGTDRTFWIEQLYTADPAQQDVLRDRLRLTGAAIADVVEGLKRMSSAQRKILLEGIVDEAMPCPATDRMLTWEQVRRLEQGGVTIGSHTVTHPLLTYESAEIVTHELAESKREIEHRLGPGARDFAYPNGDHNANVAAAVRAQGYRRAYTTETRWASANDDPFAIPRFLLHDGAVTSPSGKFSPAVFLLAVLR
jgi:peptidoglycan/xylan/chitin deacetylase (PgdA/CDA1 family)